MSPETNGDDEEYQLPDEEKDRLEATLRREARDALKQGKPKVRREKLNRATNISRRKSKRAQHH